MGKKKFGDKGFKKHPSINTQYFVGVILAPKSLYPCAVWKSDNNYNGVTLTSLDGETHIGSGYFGDEGPRSCIRQHMLPGLADPKDNGNGLGSALYLGGIMVTAAIDSDCTFSAGDENYGRSYGGGRSEDADRAWSSLVQHDLAEEETASESEPFSRDIDVESLIGIDSIEEHVRNYELEDADSVDIDYVGNATVEGTAEVQATFNFMEWEVIRESGLVLYINLDSTNQPIPTLYDRSKYPPLRTRFREDEDYVPPPPIAIAKADWSECPKNLLISILLQNAQYFEDGSPSEYMSAVYEAAKEQRANSKAESALVELITTLEFDSRQTVLPFERIRTANHSTLVDEMNEMLKGVRRNPRKRRKFVKPKISTKTRKFLKTYDREFSNEFLKGDWA
jgi:hypothetical protein